jgi:hypothetical protein
MALNSRWEPHTVLLFNWAVGAGDLWVRGSAQVERERRRQRPLTANNCAARLLTNWECLIWSSLAQCRKQGIELNLFTYKCKNHVFVYNFSKVFISKMFLCIYKKWIILVWRNFMWKHKINKFMFCGSPKFSMTSQLNLGLLNKHNYKKSAPFLQFYWSCAQKLKWQLDLEKDERIPT